jgi:hypothetical protein
LTVVVGNSDVSVESKVAALKVAGGKKGWISRLSEAELRYYAQRTISTSGELRRISPQMGVSYIEVECDSFDYSIEKCAEQIARSASITD